MKNTFESSIKFSKVIGKIDKRMPLQVFYIHICFFSTDLKQTVCVITEGINSTVSTMAPRQYGISASKR